MTIERFTRDEAIAKIGQRVRARITFSGVPAGTMGIVLEPDDATVPVQWALPRRGKALVDWFDRGEYERYLEEVANGGLQPPVESLVERRSQ